MNAELKKISENEYIITADPFECRHEETKEVVVDGEVYSRTIRSTYLLSLEDNFNDPKNEISNFGSSEYLCKGAWFRDEIDEFNSFGNQTIYVWRYQDLNIDTRNELPYFYSQNPYINLLCNLFRHIKIKNIKDVLCCKNNEYRYSPGGDNYLKDLIRTRTVHCEIINYGYNNSVYAEIGLNKFLKMDFANSNERIKILTKELTYHYPDLFPQKLFEGQLNEIELNNLAMNFLNKSINLKQQGNV